jgi:putative membrane protein
MRNFLIRLLISTIAIIVITSGILPGIRVEGSTNTLIGLGIVFGLLNVIVKPILKFLTCPLIILTLGLFVFILNALTLQLVALLSDSLVGLLGGRLVIDTFGWALVGSLIVTIVTIILESLLGARETKKHEVRTVTEVRYVVEKQKENLDREFDQLVGSPPPGFKSVTGEDDFDDPDFGKPKR